MKEEARLIIRRKVGERIKEVREQKGLSLRKLEAISEVDFSWLSKLEKGQINFSIDSLTKVMKALKIQPGDLFDFKLVYRDEE